MKAYGGLDAVINLVALANAGVEPTATWMKSSAASLRR